MLRFYAGAPLVTEDGVALGMLAVADTRVRTLPPVAVEVLRELAKQVMCLLESRRRATLLRHLQDERMAMVEAARQQAGVARLTGQVGRLGSFYVDLSTQAVVLSGEACQALGSAERSLSSRRAAAAFAPDHRRVLLKRFAQSVATRAAFDEELELLVPTARTRVRVVMRPDTTTGTLMRLDGVVQVISGRSGSGAQVQREILATVLAANDSAVQHYGQTAKEPVTHRCKNDMAVAVEARWNLVHGGQTGTTSALCVHTDVSEPCRAERVTHPASYDDFLVRRPNRREFEQAKRNGRNTVSFLDPVVQRVLTERVALEVDLSHAVLRNELVLHYQPQVSRDGSVIGAEALVRWLSPSRGVVSPGDFIPLAERTGLILGIGEWVIEAACALLSQWAQVPQLRHLTLAVNVSVAQFQQQGFVQQVVSSLRHSGASPQMLKLELTETMLAPDVEVVVDKMRALRSLGVQLSLDDFGTGYSSLAYLSRMPLDQLKIDQSFVRGLLSETNGAAIAKTIITLAHSMSLHVVAEGVETAQQRDWLVAHCCDAFQGYLYSRPVPADQFEAMLTGED